MTLEYNALRVISAKNAMLRRARRLGFMIRFTTSAAGLTVTRTL
jgi:hypothetical protein